MKIKFSDNSSMILNTSSMPWILFAASFFNELWSFLSSAFAGRWMIFFLRRAVP
jgi:hypothetical protein